MKTKTTLIPLLVVALLSSCASVEQQSETVFEPKATAAPIEKTAETESESAGVDRFSATPVPPIEPLKASGSEDSIESRLSDEKVDVNFYDMPVARFVNEVFGNILKVGFEIDDAISRRDDLVTLRSAVPVSHKELYRMSLQVLSNYGVGMLEQGTHIRFVVAQDPENTEPPLFVTGAANPDVPSSHRTVFQFVPLSAVRENTVRGWIEVAYKDTGLVAKSDALTNSVVLQGPRRVVQQAAETIKVLDRPSMRGRYSVRISPSFVSAADLSKMLTEVLESEGVAAVQKPPFGAVIILPMLPTNSVIAFSSSLQMLEHIKEWAVELDQPVSQTGSDDFYYYQVRNTSASELAAALAGVQTDGTTIASPAGVFVDENRNGLIFTGDSKGWRSYLPIVKAMDRPARLVNVEVTVASVTLTDDTDIGIEWLFNDQHGDFSGVGRTNFGIGSSGFSYSLDNLGQVRFALNALSQDSRVSILSKPSIMVKSGDTASIDVGQEVPIITSQAQSTDAVDAPVLQSITYRKTGVLLQVSPTVHSGNRVDMELKQEVSEVLDSVASSVDSPSIFNRRLETTLTLNDGGAIILGGLVSGSTNEGSSKVPVLGNIPGFGALFRSSGNQEVRSELILVIQAYIIDIEEKDWNFSEQLNQKLDLLDLETLKLK